MNNLKQYPIGSIFTITSGYKEIIKKYYDDKILASWLLSEKSFVRATPIGIHEAKYSHLIWCDSPSGKIYFQMEQVIFETDKKEKTRNHLLTTMFK